MFKNTYSERQREMAHGFLTHAVKASKHTTVQVQIIHKNQFIPCVLGLMKVGV